MILSKKAGKDGQETTIVLDRNTVENDVKQTNNKKSMAILYILLRLFMKIIITMYMLIFIGEPL